MALLKSDGTPVARAPVTIQLDLPCEAADATLSTPNWGGVLAAGIQLVLALMTGNTAGIASAIQQLINAIMGN